MRPALDRERIRRAYPPFPRQLIRPIEKLAEVLGLERAYPHEHPVGGTKPDVRPAYRRFITTKQYSARVDDLSVISESLDLPLNDGLKTESSGGY